MPRGYASTLHGQIHYVEHGAGPVLVLLGSAGRSAHVFDRLMGLLAPDFRVIALDMLGCGSSDPLPEDAAIETFAESVVGLLDHLGLERANVYGFHIGNKIAAALAARWPERVDRVILAGQSHSLIPGKEKREARLHGHVGGNLRDPDADEARNRLKLWATSYRRLTDFWWHDSVMSNPQDPEVFEQMRNAVIDRLQSQNSIAAISRAVLAYDLEPDLRRIRAETLILEAITASEDREVGRQGEALARILRNARVAQIHIDEGPSHTVTLIEHYPEVARLVRGFLRDGMSRG